MYKKNINKKVSYISTYVILGIIVMGIMFISPNLNKNIYAASSYSSNPNSRSPFRLSTDGSFRTEEYKQEQEALMKLYEEVGKNSTALQEYKNLNYSETSGANQARNTLSTKEMLDIEDPLGFFENTGKMFDPIGNRAVHEGNVNGYSASEWVRDPGVFCIDVKTPITGKPDDSRGRNARPGYVRDSSSIHSATSWANGTGEGNAAANERARQAIVETLVNSNVLSPEHASAIQNDLGSRISNLDNSLGDALNLIGTNNDYVRPEGTFVSQLGSSNIQTSDNRITSEERSNLITEFENGGAQTNVSTSGQTYIRDTGNVEAIANNLGTVTTTDAPATTSSYTNGVQNYLSNEVQTSAGEVETQTKTVLRYEAPILDNEAYLAFIVTAYQQRQYASDQLSKVSDGVLQSAVWRTPVGGGDINSEVRASWLNESAAGVNVNDNSLNAEALAFQKYWEELKNFPSSKGPFPNDGYQTFLRGKAYHADVQITKSFDSAPGQADEELIIKNPKIIYEPRILPGNGSTMKDSSVVNFDTTTQKWIIGPYKVDYLLATNGKEGNSNTVETDIQMKKYFSGITKVSLFGKYREDQGQTPQVTSPSGYDPGIQTFEVDDLQNGRIPSTTGQTAQPENNQTNTNNVENTNNNTNNTNVNTENNQVTVGQTNTVVPNQLTLTRGNLHKKALSTNEEFEIYNTLVENIDEFVNNEEKSISINVKLSEGQDNKNFALAARSVEAFINDNKDSLYTLDKSNFLVQIQNVFTQDTNEYVHSKVIVTKRGYAKGYDRANLFITHKPNFIEGTKYLANQVINLGNLTDAQKVSYVNTKLVEAYNADKASKISEDKLNYAYPLFVQRILSLLNMETGIINATIIDSANNYVGKQRAINLVKIENKWYTLDIVGNAIENNYLLLSGKNTFESKYKINDNSIFKPLYDAFLTEVNDYDLSKAIIGIKNENNMPTRNDAEKAIQDTLNANRIEKRDEALWKALDAQHNSNNIAQRERALEEATNAAIIARREREAIDSYNDSMKGFLDNGSYIAPGSDAEALRKYQERQVTLPVTGESENYTNNGTLPNGGVGAPATNTVEIKKERVLPVRTERLSVIPEGKLLNLEQDPDKFNTKQQEESEGLKPIENWRLKIKREAGSEALTTPGMVNRNDYTEGIPAPNEEFFFEVDYDPSLIQVNKARFEFAYIIFGGNRREYQLYKGKLKDIKITTTTTVGLEGQTFDYIHYSVNDQGETESSILREFGYVPTQRRQVNVSFNETVQQEQSQMSVEALRWVEEVAVELRFTTPETSTPPTPEGNKLSLLIPIGGRVWEDRQDHGSKHVGYDNIYGTDTDINLEGIKVTVFRNLVEWDQNKVPKRILNRQYARLFNQNGEETGLTELYTDANGRYGTYYIHDIGFTEEEYITVINKDTVNYGITFSVRWDYDGIAYEPVTPLSLGATDIEASSIIDRSKKFNTSSSEEKEQFKNSSFGFENKLVRERFNQVNATVAGNTPNNNGKTIGKTVAAGEIDPLTGKEVLPQFSGNGSRNISYTEEQNVSNDEFNGIRRTRSNYDISIPSQRRKTDNNNSGLEINSDEWVNEFINATTLEIGLKLPANEKIRYSEDTKDIDSAFNEIAGKYFAANKYMENINLGLRRRKPVDLTIKKSLNNAAIFVNKKAYNYTFTDLNNDMLTEEEKAKEGMGYNIDFTTRQGLGINNKDASLIGRDTKKINQVLDLYKTDYIYRTAMYSGNTELYEALKNEVAIEKKNDELDNANGGSRDPRQLDVFVTYKLEATNNSPVDIARIEAIDDYYNSNLELVDRKVEKTIEKHSGSLENIVDPGVSTVEEAVEQAKKSQNDQILDRSEVKIPKAAFTISSKHDEKLREIDTEKAKEMATENLAISNEPSLYKQAMNLPNELSVSRLATPIELAPDQRADILLTFRVKNVNSIMDIANSQNADKLGELYGNIQRGELKQLSQALSLGDFENVAEIARFTTYDLATKLTSGKVDITSAPDNIDLSNVKEALINRQNSVVFEDDTDSAPIISIKIKEETEENPVTRTISGKLFEDKRNLENKGVATGNGTIDEGEETIPNHPVTLEERVSVRASSLPAVGTKDRENILFNSGADQTGKPEINNIDFVDIPFIWPRKIEVENVIQLEVDKVTGFNSTVLTGNEGEEKGLYKFVGVPAGNMVVSLDYTSPKDKTSIFEKENGKASVTAIQNNTIAKEDLVETANSKEREVKYYNGMDFKNTMFYAKGGNNDILKKDDYTDPLNVYLTWLDKDKFTAETQNNSYLRDDEGRRIQVTTTFEELTNDNVKYVNLFRTNNSLSGVISEEDFKEKLNKAHQLSSMRATTPKMNFSIEHYEVLDNSTNNFYDNNNMVQRPTTLTQFKDLYAVEGNYANSGQSQAKRMGYNVTNINLGLVERPKTKVVMNKEVKNITLTTADGKTPININFIPEATVAIKKDSQGDDYGKSITGEKEVVFGRRIDEKTSVGTEFLMNLDRSSFVDGVATGNPSDILKAGFRYINIDKSLLQDSTISIKYGVYAYNLGELDRKIDLKKAVENGVISANSTKEQLDESLSKFSEKAYRVGLDIGDATGNTQIDPNKYGYGAYLGLSYYMFDNVPELELDKDFEYSGIKVGTVMDLVDTSTDVNKDDEINKNWTPADKDDLVGLVQNIENNDADIINSNGESYIQDLGSALSGNNSTTNNSSTTTAITSTSAAKPKEDSNVKSRVFLLHQNEIEIKPATLNGEITFDGSTKNTNNDYKVEWEIKTDKTLSSQTDSSDLVFENIIELLKYTSGTGRSDYTIPGNVIPQLDNENGVGNGIIPGNINETGVALDSDGKVKQKEDGLDISNPDLRIDVTDRTFKATTIEHDSASSETVRASEPTGLSEMTTANRVAILVTIITIGIAATVLLITDTKKSKK